MEGSVVNDDAPMFHGLLDGAFYLNYNSDKFTWNARRETTFESEETQEFWVEEVRGNRRIIVLGANWRF